MPKSALPEQRKATCFMDQIFSSEHPDCLPGELVAWAGGVRPGTEEHFGEVSPGYVLLWVESFGLRGMLQDPNHPLGPAYGKGETRKPFTLIADFCFPVWFLYLTLMGREAW